MRILTTVIAAVLLHFFLFTSPCTADIISLKLRSNKRHTILFRKFEFSHHGYVSFVIPSVTATSTSSPPPDPSRIGFLLQYHEIGNQHRFEFQQNTKCPLDFKLNTVLFTFQDLLHDPQSSFNKTYPVTYPGMYSLVFVNCNENSVVSTDGNTELYNMNDGTTKNYLPANQLTKLPCLYLFSSFIYLGFLARWILVCLKNRRSFNRVHSMMSGLLVLNFAQLICAGADLYFVKVTGTSHGFDDLFCWFRLMRTLLLFTVIISIFTGWCFWKPSLEEREKVFFMIVMVLQVWSNVSSFKAWKARHWASTSRAIDIICYIVLLYPMAFSFESLKKDDKTNGNAAMNLEKLSGFGLVVFVCLIFMTVLKFKWFSPWVTYGVEEIILLLLCMGMFYIYKPLDEDNVYKTVDMAGSAPPGATHV